MVTEESLHKAFPNMNASQAQMIMNWLKKILSEVHHTIERLAEHVCTLATHAEQTVLKLDAMEEQLSDIVSKLPPPNAAEAGAVARDAVAPSDGQMPPQDSQIADERAAELLGLLSSTRSNRSSRSM
eukprot:CAMPEP_0170637778 /NCGR_PEP_ID=MMETSP0224-20130122/38622_1 /TAXON_ID=285029 /ORGANISM="Togula jolla, Strain CCCM 725" /LENGTH=126 /DNA_ID=CAMNT_0010967739 /DNA_START=1 /DNA_END=382 /DNA_ORIENTATION=-